MFQSSTIRKFNYFSLNKTDKGPVRKYIMLVTGSSRPQMNRLLERKLLTGEIKEVTGHRNKFPTIYTRSDIELLAETDNLHERMGGPATKVILKREHERFNNPRFARLKNISPAHIYYSVFKTISTLRFLTLPSGTLLEAIGLSAP